MSSVINRNAHPVVVALASALAIAACGTGSPALNDNQSATLAPAPSAEPQGVEPPSATLAALGKIAPGTELPGTELPDTQAYGQWKVIDAAGPASGRAMIGRTLSFTEEALGWQDASGKVASGCPDHVYHIAQMAMEVKNAAPRFRPGWAKFRLPPADVGPMHVWECGDATSVFGPAETGGSVFVPVGTDRMVMNWLGGTVLLLRRQPG
jgi:hypothetical protein